MWTWQRQPLWDGQGTPTAVWPILQPCHHGPVLLPNQLKVYARSGVSSYRACNPRLTCNGVNTIDEVVVTTLFCLEDSCTPYCLLWCATCLGIFTVVKLESSLLTGVSTLTLCLTPPTTSLLDPRLGLVLVMCWGGPVISLSCCNSSGHWATIPRSASPPLINCWHLESETIWVSVFQDGWGRGSHQHHPIHWGETPFSPLQTSLSTSNTVL